VAARLPIIGQLQNVEGSPSFYDASSHASTRQSQRTVQRAPAALKTRDGSRQTNDPFKELEERRVLCAFVSIGECPVAVL
jgi:hypothetical protein